MLADGRDLRQRLLCRKGLGTLTIHVSQRNASTEDERKRKQARAAREAKQWSKQRPPHRGEARDGWARCTGEKQQD